MLQMFGNAAAFTGMCRLQIWSAGDSRRDSIRAKLTRVAASADPIESNRGKLLLQLAVRLEDVQPELRVGGHVLLKELWLVL
jgi:hypothetical protein